MKSRSSEFKAGEDRARAAAPVAAFCRQAFEGIACTLHIGDLLIGPNLIMIGMICGWFQGLSPAQVEAGTPSRRTGRAAKPWLSAVSTIVSKGKRSMGLTSEQVHWIFGGVLVAASSMLLLREARRLDWPAVDYLLPVLLAVFGMELLLDPLVHGDAAPANYAAETAQHFTLGILLLATSAAELLRVARGWRGLAGRLPLAAALAAAAGAFLFHAQHDSEAPMILLMTQHRMIGATLGAAALAVLIGRSQSDDSGYPPALPFLMLLLGAQLLIYTEGGSLMAGSPRHLQEHGG